jgi:hypothetical protein
MGLTMAKKLTPEQRQAIIQGLNVLGAAAAPGYAVAGSVKGRQITEVRSLTGVVPSAVVIGGLAGVYNYRRANPAHGGPAAAKTNTDPKFPPTVLRRGILPAEIQFQAGAYRDQDGDGIGEYGLLSELNGGRDVGDGQRLFLFNPSSTIGDYSYTVYLPGGATRVADDGKTTTRASIPANADDQEKTFVAYAWPARTKDGIMYALVDEVIYEAPYKGLPPAWNAVFDGAGFEAKPKWAVSPDTGTEAAPEPTNVP